MVSRDYKAEKDRCKQFLNSYTDEYSLDAQPFKYMEQMQEIANRKRRELNIHLDDVKAHDGEGEGSLLSGVMTNTRRYISLFAEAADELMPQSSAHGTEDDVFDVLMRQREQAEAENLQNGQVRTDSAQQLPAALRRRYRVYFKPLSKPDVVRLRDVRAKDIGKLVTVKGIVTRVNDVKPLMEFACYTCDDCGFEIYQEVTGDNFMPLQQCPTSVARTNGGAGQLNLQTRACKFLKFQEIKLQEMSEDVPMGHIPRAMTIQVKGELVRQMAPGDLVEVTGIFLPKPYAGFRGMRAGLVTNTYLEATAIRQYKKRYSEYVVTPELKERIAEYATDADIYGKLAKSIAPEIFGHEDVKKALMLLLVGGSPRHLPDGMRIRGDIHICLMGDPGVAKSQLLKSISTIAPRGVYTTGKGSSGVGLTAAVVRDPMTNEFMLEGGALVLADMGICCIDEFDKMEDSDRTAIHEVMEQQTVSIAKAGITTTLNARTAVLAAANPVGGRYNPALSPQENINLPAALLSRFDLLWLILDKADVDADKELAKHVLHVHRHCEHPALGFEPLPNSELRAYVALARRTNPYVPEELTEFLAAAYAEMRQEELEKGDRAHSYTTARTLLSIIRVSEGLARLRMADAVAQTDVDEAMRLMKMSKSSLADSQQKKKGKEMDPVTEIYTLIRAWATRFDKLHVDGDQIKRLLGGKKFPANALENCFEEYKDIGVWVTDEEDGGIRFIE